MSDKITKPPIINFDVELALRLQKCLSEHIPDIQHDMGVILADAIIDTHVLDYRVAALRNGNTKLISALMDMCLQYLTTEDGEFEVCDHYCMAAGEEAERILVSCGMAENIDGRTFRLLWDELLKRRPEKTNV